MTTTHAAAAATPTLTRAPGHSISAPQGDIKEQVYFYYRAAWRGQPVMVTVTADRYTYHAVDTRAARLTDWRLYVSNARVIESEESPYTGAHPTDTARQRLSAQVTPLARAWIDGPDYAASEHRAYLRMVLSECRDLSTHSTYVAGDRVHTLMAKHAAKLTDADRATVEAILAAHAEFAGLYNAACAAADGR